MEKIYLTIALAPLLGALITGLGGRLLSRTAAHRIAIAGVMVSFALSLFVLYDIIVRDAPVYNDTVYTWARIGAINFEIGFLIDGLTALMMSVVTCVSLLVHIYTIGYMHDDPGYKRFFSYISLFTFSMLMLVMSNNFLQLFFGWEAVGLVSYLLIGFWYQRPTAIFANLKAFLVNRVGDFGFLLGIAAIMMYSGTLDYASVFRQAPALAQQTIAVIPGHEWGLLTVACLLLFVGAMGKSAQVPLHVWLPDSMEGPTPISALIHAATMVTAGVFMVARMSPLFEHSEVALNAVLVIGAITALFMGFIGLVQNDIKRVVAYSTLSQLGYMTVALGASAYSVAIFHLMTHAFFKALLFLGAGSVIIGMHHEQDMQKMGGLRKYMPITYWTGLLGTLALIGFPGFSGYYSKDMIIAAVHASDLPAAHFAYYAVLFGVLITAVYSFRLLFLTFHGEFRGSHDHDHGHHRHDHSHDHHPHESPWVVTLPLILLAIPSVVIGALTAGALINGDYFADSIVVLPGHPAMEHLREEYHGPFSFALHAVANPVFYLMLAGIVIAWFCYIRHPGLPAQLAQRFAPLHRLLLNKYGFDDLYQFLFAGGARALGAQLWKKGDVMLVDGLVNGTAHTVGRLAGVARRLQTGYLYHYAFTMIVGLLILLAWWTLW
jgi:NADH-quinone oxidoreductase subunit L